MAKTTVSYAKNIVRRTLRELQEDNPLPEGFPKPEELRQIQGMAENINNVLDPKVNAIRVRKRMR